MTGVYGSPYVPAPDRVGAGTLVSGGGGDGHIDHVVAFILQRVDVRPEHAVSAAAVPPGLRAFDLAELISWAAWTAGVTPRPPEQADLLRAHCYRYRAGLPDVETGMAVKGALLFGQGTVGLALGMRRRVIVHDFAAGVVVDEQRIRRWREAALLPGAKGYR